LHSPPQLFAARAVFVGGATLAAALADGSSSGGGGGGGGTATLGCSEVDACTGGADTGGELGCEIRHTTRPPASSNIAIAAETYDPLLLPVWGLEGKSLDISQFLIVAMGSTTIVGALSQCEYYELLSQSMVGCSGLFER
jgi:hypothetical protein